MISSRRQLLVSGVKFSSGDENEAVLEVKLDWQHTRDAKIVIQLHTTGPLLTVQVIARCLFASLHIPLFCICRPEVNVSS